MLLSCILNYILCIFNYILPLKDTANTRA